MERNWAEWLNAYKTDKNAKGSLNQITDLILTLASLNPTDKLLDIGTGLGRLGFKAYEELKENGKVVAIDSDSKCIAECQKYVEENNISANYELYNMDLNNNSLSSKSFDVVVSRSVIMHILDKEKAINEIYRLLNDDGRISLFECTVYSKLERICSFLNAKNITNFKKIKKIEELIRNDCDDPLTNSDIKSIKKYIKNAGFSDIKIFSIPEYDYWKFTKENIDELDGYLAKDALPLHISTTNKFLKHLTEEEFNKFLSEAKADLINKYFYQKIISHHIIALKNPSISSKLNFMLVGMINGFLFGFTNIIQNVNFKIKWFVLSRARN